MERIPRGGQQRQTARNVRRRFTASSSPSRFYPPNFNIQGRVLLVSII
jgi:hypothetical protein